MIADSPPIPSKARFERLHPGTIVIEFARVLGRFAVALFLFVVLSLSGGRGDQLDVGLTVLGLLGVLAAFLRYLTTTFAIESGFLIVRSGILHRMHRTIPLDRIQNVNVSRSLLHRLLGLVDLNIETAGGVGVEASLSALGEDQAALVKSRLTGKSLYEFPRFLLDDPDLIFRAGWREVLLTGATENRALTVLSGVLGLVFLTDLDTIARGVLERLLRAPLEAYSPHVLVAASLLGLFFVGWMAAIAGAVLTYGNFELRRVEDRIRRHYGLLNQVESYVPFRRVQALRTSANLVQKALGVLRMHVDTASSYIDREGGGQTLLAPLVPDAKAESIARIVLAGYEPRANVWQPISRRSVHAHFRRWILPSIILSVAAALYHPWGGLLYPALLALGSLSAWIRYRTTFYADQGAFFAVRKGWLVQRTHVVPTDKVQAVTLSESPVQRRFGLLDVDIVIPTLVAPVVTVPDLDRPVAEELMARLRERSRRAPATDGL